MAAYNPNFDPEPAQDFWHGSELERMVVGCEVATDEFVTAVDRHSTAEAAYLRARHVVYQQLASDPKRSQASIDRACEEAAVEERIAMKRAEGLRDAAQALMRSRLSVLSAAQSQLRSVERQT